VAKNEPREGEREGGGWLLFAGAELQGGGGSHNNTDSMKYIFFKKGSSAPATSHPQGKRGERSGLLSEREEEKSPLSFPNTSYEGSGEKRRRGNLSAQFRKKRHPAISKSSSNLLDGNEGGGGRVVCQGDIMPGQRPLTRKRKNLLWQP